MALMSLVMVSQRRLSDLFKMRRALRRALTSRNASLWVIPSWTFLSRTPARIACQRLGASSLTWYGASVVPTCTSDRTGMRTTDRLLICFWNTATEGYTVAGAAQSFGGVVARYRLEGLAALAVLAMAVLVVLAHGYSVRALVTGANVASLAVLGALQAQFMRSFG